MVSSRLTLALADHPSIAWGIILALLRRPCLGVHACFGQLVLALFGRSFLPWRMDDRCLSGWMIVALAEDPWVLVDHPC